MSSSVGRICRSLLTSATFSTSSRCNPLPTSLRYASSSSSTSSPTPPSPAQARRPSSAHLTPSESATKKIEEQDTLAPPPLTRALGVPEIPTPGKVQSREEWRRDLLSRERRLKERKHLVQQVSKGYFNDYNQLRHSGGKTFLAPKTLIREDISLYFPDITGVSLANKIKTHTTNLLKDKVSLVAMSSFKSSEEHINSFVRPTLSDMREESSFQFVQINLQENPLKSFLVTLFLSSLRSTVPVEYHPTYLLSHQSLEYLRDSMGMANKHVGYLFLVDQDLKIRWAGCGFADLEEEEALRKCSRVLLERLKSLQ